MSYKIIEKSSGEVKLEISVSALILKKATDLVMNDLGKNLKISGFRPGKAPQFLIEKEVGKDRFWAEVMDKAIPEAFFEAVIAEKIITLSAPQIQVQKFVPGETLIFEATVAVIPEFKDLKYKDLKIKEKKEKITDIDKKHALDELLKRSSTEKATDRPAKVGDKVEIDFEGTLNGLPFDGNKSKNHPVVLGSGMLVPGFEEKIVGHHSGQEFEFDIDFPSDYHAKNLAGQKVHFKVRVNSVLEISLPEANDDWAKNAGFPDLLSLKKELEKQLQYEKDIQVRRVTEEEILNKIIDKNKIEAPKTLATEEIHRMVHEAEHNLSHSGMSLNQFLEMSNKTISELEEEMKPEAEKRVKIGITLGEISRIENLKVEDAEIEAEIEKLTSMSGSAISKEDLRAAYETPERRKEIGNSIIIQKTMQKLWEYNVA